MVERVGWRCQLIARLVASTTFGNQESNFVSKSSLTYHRNHHYNQHRNEARTPRIATLFGAVALLLSPSIVSAQKQNDYTNGLNGTPNVPGANIGGVDKTAAGPLFPGAQANLDATFRAQGNVARLKSNVRDWCQLATKPIGSKEDIRNYLDHHVPRAILCVGTQARFGNGSAVYAQEIMYSSLTTGLDIAVQPFLSDQQGLRRDGIGFSVRYDLAKTDDTFKRNERALDRIASEFRKILRDDSDLKGVGEKPGIEKANGADNSVARRVFNVLDKNRTIKNLDNKVYLPLVSDFLKVHYNAHLALLANYRILGGGQRVPANSLGSLGLVASKQSPLGSVKPGVSSLTGIVTVQALTFSQSGSSGSSAIRTGLGLTWQNRTPALSADGAHLERWNFQVGTDYLFENAVDRSSNATAFVRYRDTRNNFDYTVFAGTGSHSAGYFGVNITGAIRLY